MVIMKLLIGLCDMGGEFGQELKRVESAGVSVSGMRLLGTVESLVGVGIVMEFLKRNGSFGNVVGQVFQSVAIAPVYFGTDKGIEAAVMP